MKKLSICMISALLTFTLVPLDVKAEKAPKSTTVVVTDPLTKEEVEVLIGRLEELKAMDRSVMDKSEKKELRKEVREIEKELKRNANGVYLSIGAIIIIALLLILLL